MPAGLLLFGSVGFDVVREGGQTAVSLSAGEGAPGEEEVPPQSSGGEGPRSDTELHRWAGPDRNFAAVQQRGGGGAGGG